jgi:glycosyltransferase involved in cell wall biosynthesis
MIQAATINDELQKALQRVYVVIPVLNEEKSIGLVLADLPPVGRVVVVDNGSTDQTAKVAADAGADVVSEPQRGYGKACLTGIARVNEVCQAINEHQEEPILVFVDGDHSDHAEELPALVSPIVNDESDFVIGSRTQGKRESGAMHFQAIFGNWLACSLMKLFWGASFTDLGPFRAIRLPSLNALDMQDENFGWTIEMQIKAVKAGLRYQEVPASYRCRVGVSKISGTISGTIRAGYKILYTIFRQRFMKSE